MKIEAPEYSIVIPVYKSEKGVRKRGQQRGASPEWHFLKGFFRAEIVSNSGRNVALIT